jgi:hypothetical protein
MMALTNVSIPQSIGHDVSNTFELLIQFDGDSSYPAGGYLTFEATVQAAADMGALNVISVTRASGAYIFDYDRSEDKLMFMTVNASTGLIEEASGDVSGTYTAIVRCR